MQIYLNFIRNYASAKLLGRPDFSTEIYHWARYYHEKHKTGSQVNGKIKFKQLKDPIRFGLDKLTKSFKEPLDLVEVGSGPTSQFWSEELIKYPIGKVVAVDPLAPFYAELHRKYRTGYSIDLIESYGETLNTAFPQESFHLVYSQNAIDHSISPILFVQNLCRIIKPGGCLILKGYVNEGSNARWLGLHHWDIEYEDNYLLLSNRSKSINRKSLTENLPLELVWSKSEKGVEYTVMYKKSA